MFKNVNGIDVEMSPEEVTVFEAGRPEVVISPTDVRNEGARRLEALFSEYSTAERETWPQQIAEATALAADGRASAPLLRSRVLGRESTLATLASLVLTKARAGWNASGFLLSKQDELLAMSPIPQDYANDSYWLDIVDDSDDITTPEIPT
jgi:hypothetical protein